MRVDNVEAAMRVLFVVLFIVVPLLELYVLIQVGGTIGVLPTIGLLIVDSLLGAFLLRHQGRSAWSRLNVAMAEGRIPARETIDGALVIFGGALLLTPGFLTDIAGLLLLIPPTRAVVRPLLVRWSARRMTVAAMTVRGAGRAGSARFDVDGTATEAGRDAGRLQP